MKSHNEMTWTSGLIPMIEPEIVTEIISRITDLALVLSQTGQVLGVLSNPNFKARFGLARWEGQPLRELLTVESIVKFEHRLEEFLKDRTKAVRPVELNHKATSEQAEFPVRYSLHHIGNDGAILMLGQDLRPIAEMQQQLVAAQIALEQDYEAQREYDTRLRVLMAAMDQGTLFVTASDGRIEDCNAAAATLLGRRRADLIGTKMIDLLQGDADDKLVEELGRRAANGKTGEVSVRSLNTQQKINLYPTMFRTAGEQMLLCRMVEQGETSAPRARELADHLTGIYERGTDAIVFVSQSGTLLSANDAFVRLTSVTHTMSLKDRPFSDFLGRGTVDLNVMIENTSRTGAMRLYATRIIGEHGTEVAVEIATTQIATGDQPVYALVIRDAGRGDATRNAGAQITDVDARSIVELIGSHSLKGIVAKTTDVIEKMCIETAVELTSNNRVAAAEMLGLSRQSLYVKLRKYDLVKKEPQN